MQILVEIICIEAACGILPSAASKLEIVMSSQVTRLANAELHFLSLSLSLSIDILVSLL